MFPAIVALELNAVRALNVVDFGKLAVVRAYDGGVWFDFICVYHALILSNPRANAFTCSGAQDWRAGLKPPTKRAETHFG